MSKRKTLRQRKLDITTAANQAAIIQDALDQPTPDIQGAIPKKPITDEISSEISDPWWQYYVGQILINPDKTLRAVGGGFNNTEIFEDLLRDPQVLSNMQTRRLAVTGKEWDVTPASDKRQDIKIAEFVKDVLDGFDFATGCFNLLQGILTGFKVSEVMWKYSEGDIFIDDMIAKPSRRFVFGLKRELRLITRSNMVEGFPVPDRKFQLYRYAGQNGSPYGDGLGSCLYWPVWFKKNGLKFWLIFCEKFGSPTPIGKYPVGTPKDQQAVLLNALTAIQQETGITIPENLTIEFLEAKRTGSTDLYELLQSFLNEEITKVIMGQTLTTGAGHSGRGSAGGKAAAATHEEVRDDYIIADSASLSNHLNRQLIPWIVDYNFDGVTQYPKFSIRAAAEKDQKPLADLLAVLQKMGLEIPEDVLYTTFDIRKPDPNNPDDKVLVPLAGGPQVNTSTSGEDSDFAERGNKNPIVLHGRKLQQEDPIDRLVSLMHQDAPNDAFVQPVMDLVAHAQSFDEIQRGMKSLSVKLGPDSPVMKKMQVLMQRAFATANLSGRAME